MVERYYILYNKAYDDSMEDRVREYHHNYYGRHCSLETKIKSASYFDDDEMVSIVTVVE